MSAIVERHQYQQSATYRSFTSFETVYERTRTLDLGLARILDTDIVTALTVAKTSSEFKDLALATIPSLIKILKKDTLLANLPCLGIDTISGEYQTNQGKDRLYVLAHRDHPLLSLNTLARGLKRMDNRYFMPITQEETKQLLKHAYSIRDLRRGVDWSDRTIIINLDKDNPFIYSGDRIGYDEWMRDDLILAICGCEENRNWLGGQLKQRNFGDGFLNTMRMPDMPFGRTVGRLLSLDKDLNIEGTGKYRGAFLGITQNPEKTEEKKVLPPLEQILDVGSAYIADCNKGEYRLRMSALFEKIKNLENSSGG